jgi:hypothetical protein
VDVPLTRRSIEDPLYFTWAAANRPKSWREKSRASLLAFPRFVREYMMIDFM